MTPDVRLDIHEDGLGSTVDGVCARREGQCRHEHLVARLDAQPQQREMERGRAVRAALSHAWPQ